VARPSGLRAVQRLASFMRREEISSVAAGRRALRAEGFTPPSYATVRTYSKGLFRRDERDRYVVTKRDYSPRIMDAVSVRRGVERNVAIRSSNDASKISRWANALRDFLQTGDDSRLAELTEREVTIRSGRAILETDPAVLQRMADAGELDDFLRNYHEGRRR
jgi:hypothetical protein